MSKEIDYCLINFVYKNHMKLYKKLISLALPLSFIEKSLPKFKYIFKSSFVYNSLVDKLLTLCSNFNKFNS